jgi:AmmeMemoRadiSam system protein B
VLKIRRRGLPKGWYPGTEEDIRGQLRRWSPVPAAVSAIAGVVPHAGWEFCGSMIASVLVSLSDDIQTVVVLGGHNPAGGLFINYSEDAWELPAGLYSRDSAYVDSVEKSLTEDMPSIEERNVDNTVEVVMAMAGVVKPRSKWAAWRVPSDERAIRFGELLAEAADREGRSVAVIGSTDLTHYGPNYGFMPPESRNDPVTWVEKRDRLMLDAIVSGDAERALQLSESHHSACSIGGAIAAMSFALSKGRDKGQLLSYSTSRDIYPSPSFVGYGAVIWGSE